MVLVPIVSQYTRMDLTDKPNSINHHDILKPWSALPLFARHLQLVGETTDMSQADMAIECALPDSMDERILTTIPANDVSGYQTPPSFGSSSDEDQTESPSAPSMTRPGTTDESMTCEQIVVSVDTLQSGSTTAHAWRCAFDGCSSRMLFTRQCDLRKHYQRHTQQYYCRKDGCDRSHKLNTPNISSFPSKKDRDRHEAMHDPRIKCAWRGGICGRTFSRLDNMKDHVRRVHEKRKSNHSMKQKMQES